MVTIFIDRKSSDIGIVRWFRDPKFRTILYPNPPLYRMTMQEFRISGFDLIRNYMQEFQTISVDEQHLQPVFQPDEGKKYLKKQLVVKISNEQPNILTINPLGFRKYDLGGFKDLGPEKRKKIPVDSSPELFWLTFDQALAEAE